MANLASSLAPILTSHASEQPGNIGPLPDGVRWKLESCKITSTGSQTVNVGVYSVSGNNELAFWLDNETTYYGIGVSWEPLLVPQ